MRCASASNSSIVVCPRALTKLMFEPGKTLESPIDPTNPMSKQFIWSDL